jgi:thiol-disulfide isomerase/thioredoxin
MKKIITLILLSAIGIAAFAQNTVNVSRPKLDQNSVVKDSSGMIYPYVIWQKMLQSGDYAMKTRFAMKDGKPDYNEVEFMIVKQTEQQKMERFAKMGRPADSKFFTTGETIKPFKVHDINGKKVDAKDWAGKTVVLNYWFIGCPPCRAEIPDLNKLALKYKDNPNVIFIAIALDQDYDVSDFIKKNPLAYHVVGDGRDLANMFKIHLYPTNVVIDKQGKVQLHYSGGYQNGPYWLDKTIQESEKSTTL